MTAKAKIRTLASQDSTLRGFFGTSTFRWFDSQLQPGYITAGTCARVLKVSTVFRHTHETASAQMLNRLTQPKFQIDVLDYDPERAEAAAAAIKDWLSTVDFSSDSQFASPPSSPRRHPNFVTNEWDGPVQAEPQPSIYMRCLEVRIFNLEE